MLGDLRCQLEVLPLAVLRIQHAKTFPIYPDASEKIRGSVDAVVAVSKVMHSGIAVEAEAQIVPASRIGGLVKKFTVPQLPSAVIVSASHETLGAVAAIVNSPAIEALEGILTAHQVIAGYILV